LAVAEAPSLGNPQSDAQASVRTPCRAYLPVWPEQTVEEEHRVLHSFLSNAERHGCTGAAPTPEP
jgi:hypothetical protein